MADQIYSWSAKVGFISEKNILLELKAFCYFKIFVSRALLF